MDLSDFLGVFPFFLCEFFDEVGGFHFQIFDHEKLFFFHVEDFALGLADFFGNHVGVLSNSFIFEFDFPKLFLYLFFLIVDLTFYCGLAPKRT